MSNVQCSLLLVNFLILQLKNEMKDGCIIGLSWLLVYKFSNFEAPLFTCKFNAQANQCCDPNSLRKQLANNILARSFGFIIVHAL
jgi:hypothetical protein